MWRIGGFLLICGVMGSACPRFYCGNSRPPFCLTWSRDYNEAVLHPCANDQKCPTQTFPDHEDLKCVDFNGFSMDLWNPYYGLVGRWGEYAWQPVDSFCDQQSNICEPTLYCEENLCKRRKPEAAECVQGQCELGLTCNWGVCVPAGSVQAGDRVTSEAACEYFQADSEMRCIVPSKSAGPLPQSCGSDDDCIATDGSPGHCQCAYNSAGESFCALHPGDEDYQLFLSAQAKMDVRSLPQRYYWARHYPVLVRRNSCSESSFPEVYMYLEYSHSSRLLYLPVTLSLLLYNL